MEKFDREDSSRYVSSPNPEPERETVKPVVVEKARRSRLPMVLSLLLLLALLGTATFGWLWFQQSGRVDNLETDLSSARNNVAQLESTTRANASLNEQTGSELEPSTAQVASPKTDRESLSEVAQAYTDGLIVSEKDPTAQFSIIKYEAPFALVNLATSMSGPACVFKLVNKTWIHLYCAQQETDETRNFDRVYGVPRSLTSS